MKSLLAELKPLLLHLAAFSFVINLLFLIIQAKREIFAVRREQQMHVVGHQHVGMQRAIEGPGELGQVVAKELIVLRGKEARLAVVPSLDDMNGQSG